MRVVVLSPRFLNGIVRRLREAHERREAEAAKEAAQQAAASATGGPLRPGPSVRNMSFAKVLKPDHDSTAAQVVDVMTRKVGYVRPQFVLAGVGVCGGGAGAILPRRC